MLSPPPSSPPLQLLSTPETDFIRNIYNSIRQKLVYKHFKKGFLELEDIPEIFQEYKEDHEYIILKGEKPYYQIKITTEDHDLYHLDEDGSEFKKTCYRFVKASKRGNDVYKYLINKRMKPLEKLRNIICFNEHDVDKRTSILFITLTYDNNKCSPEKAWENIGNEFNVFRHKLEKIYGHVEFIRTWESTKHYYPHVHAIIAFTKKSFIVFTHKNKDNKTSYRIPYQDVENIRSCWHSNIDVQGVSNSQGAIEEVRKYITKDLCSKKGDITNAMIWLFNKRSFSISKHFIGMINGNIGEIIDLKDVGTTDLIKDEMCNFSSMPMKWEFVGFLRGSLLGFSPEMWVIDLTDLPPNVKVLVEMEAKRQADLRDNRLKRSV